VIGTKPACQIDLPHPKSPLRRELLRIPMLPGRFEPSLQQGPSWLCTGAEPKLVPTPHLSSNLIVWYVYQLLQPNLANSPRPRRYRVTGSTDGGCTDASFAAMLSKTKLLPHPKPPSSLRYHGVIRCQNHDLNSRRNTPNIITARGGTSAELKHLIALHAPSRPVLLVAAPLASFEKLTNSALTTAVVHVLEEMGISSVGSSIGSSNADADAERIVPLVVKVPVRSDSADGGRSDMADVLRVLGPLPEVKQDCCITLVYGEQYVKEMCHSRAWPYVAASIRHCMKSMNGIDTQNVPLNTVNVYRRTSVNLEAPLE
jgi:hypothetical protein